MAGCSLKPRFHFAVQNATAYLLTTSVPIILLVCYDGFLLPAFICPLKGEFHSERTFVCVFWLRYYAPDPREGGNKRCFCLSVRPSRTWRIIRELKGLACQNLEWRFPTLEATCTPVSRSNGQRSGLQTGGGIRCRPNPTATLLVVVV